LYENIDKRIEEMFENYLIDEVKNILNMWYNKDDFWLKSIWYKEVIDYLDSKIDLKTCIELVKKNNRNYAKRQLTWFRNYEK
jgi:tRNA dimethylallyltransferase